MFPRGFLRLLLILIPVVFSGCSSNIASEKQSEGLSRPKILEEDLASGPVNPVPSPASSPVISPDPQKPVSGISPSAPPGLPGDQPNTSRAPRRFQWKDNH